VCYKTYGDETRSLSLSDLINVLTLKRRKTVSNILCIYHGNCADGFASAWVVRKFYKEVYLPDDLEFHAGVYQNPPPDVTGKDVILVDFSYKRPILDEMKSKAASILILDSP